MIYLYNNETVTIALTNGKTTTVITIGELPVQVFWQLSISKFKAFLYTPLRIFEKRNKQDINCKHFVKLLFLCKECTK